MRELSITEASYINMQRTYSMNGQLVNHIPDAVEVIRCKDCKHWKHSTIRPNYCDVWDWCNRADDFCSWAERREEE